MTSYSVKISNKLKKKNSQIDQQLLSFPSLFCLRRPWETSSDVGLGVLFRMAGLCALHPPGPPGACGRAAPGTPSGGGSSGWAHSPAASPSPPPEWQAVEEHDVVRQMSWSSGKVKKEVGNLSDRPR